MATLVEDRVFGRRSAISEQCAIRAGISSKKSKCLRFLPSFFHAPQLRLSSLSVGE